MEYVFGTKGDKEVLKTKGSSHSRLSGFHQLERVFTDQTITDSFRIVGLMKSKEDSEGNCYDWYEIDSHYRYTDKADAIRAEIKAITPYTETKTAYIGDTEITFYNAPNGNLTVFFDKPYTMEKVADRITLHFEELEEVTEITISVL